MSNTNAEGHEERPCFQSTPHTPHLWNNWGRHLWCNGTGFESKKPKLPTVDDIAKMPTERKPLLSPILAQEFIELRQIMWTNGELAANHFADLRKLMERVDHLEAVENGDVGSGGATREQRIRRLEAARDGASHPEEWDHETQCSNDELLHDLRLAETERDNARRERDAIQQRLDASSAALATARYVFQSILDQPSPLRNPDGDDDYVPAVRLACHGALDALDASHVENADIDSPDARWRTFKGPDLFKEPTSG